MPRRLILVLAILVSLRLAYPQTPPATPAKPTTGAISKTDRDKALGILDYISQGIQESYYDPKMHGLDWNAVIANAKAKIAASNSMNEALAQIAVAVGALNDSHTTFQPPARPYHLGFGFEYQMIWYKCFVTRVRPGSDADAKGLKPGQEILMINKSVPTRDNLRNIEYLDYVLNPQAVMQLEVKNASGEKREVEIKAKLNMSKDLAYRPGAGVRYDVIRDNENERHRMRMWVAQRDGIGIVRFPWFFFEADNFYWLGHQIRKDRAVIVDLRGNQGGAVETLEYFLGMFFDHDVKIYDRVGRKKTTEEIAKKEPHIYFPGKLIVLVDSESASAAELFARVMQLERRATVIGDRSSGSVMEATDFYTASSGVDYGAEVTVANVLMADGVSLEHHGVRPDEVQVPTPSDLASGSDPVLTYAAKELGVTISPADAGRLFPYEWPEEWPKN